MTYSSTLIPFITELLFAHKSQVSRERTALTQYDRVGVEIPRFQNSQLSVTRVQSKKNTGK